MYEILYKLEKEKLEKMHYPLFLWLRACSIRCMLIWDGVVVITQTGHPFKGYPDLHHFTDVWQSVWEVENSRNYDIFK